MILPLLLFYCLVASIRQLFYYFLFIIIIIIIIIIDLEMIITTMTMTVVVVTDDDEEEADEDDDDSCWICWQDLKYEDHDVELFMSDDDTRFGFSVIGGYDEGIAARVDEITMGECHVMFVGKF